MSPAKFSSSDLIRAIHVLPSGINEQEVYSTLHGVRLIYKGSLSLTKAFRNIFVNIKVHIHLPKLSNLNSIMLYHLTLFTLLASATLWQSLAASNSVANCFPYGSAALPKDLSAPNVPVSEWKCPLSMAYGFQGFSYPLEDNDCSAFSNSFVAMNADFAQMKRDFGAKIVRLYYPTCLNASVFENALKAGVANNMAVIFQVWTDFGESVGWHLSRN